MSSNMRKIKYIEEMCLASCPQLVFPELRVQLYKCTFKKERKKENQEMAAILIHKSTCGCNPNTIHLEQEDS